MDNSTDDNSVINEDLWRGWAHKDKLRDQATARKVKVVAAIALVILTLGAGLYVLTVT